MQFFFDTLIFGYLLLAGLAVFFLIRDTKSKWFKILSLFIALSWLIMFYGSFIEPRLVKITRQQIDTGKNLEKPLKIVFLSDLHIGPYKKSVFVQRIVKKIKNLNPDLVLIGGDFLFEEAKDLIHLEPLRELASVYPIYAVLGNHDKGMGSIKKNFILEPGKAEAAEKYLKTIGLNLLKNENKFIKEYNFTLAAVDTFEENLNKALSNSDKTSLKILLTHSPDIIFEAEKNKIDIVLAAHTHGGQMRLPMIGSLAIIPTDLGQSFDRGLFTFGNTKLFITSGIGEAGARARLLVPPEIALIVIK